MFASKPNKSSWLQKTKSLDTVIREHSGSKASSNSNGENSNDDSLRVERRNLSHLVQLIVRDVVESALKSDRTITDESGSLKNLFSVLEMVLLHGFVGKKSAAFSSLKQIWGMFEAIGKTFGEIDEVVKEVSNLQMLKTGMGKVRACFRIACMKKKLPDLIEAFVESKPLLSNYYSPGALLIDEEASIIQGMLVALNFIDYNFCIRDESFDDLTTTLNLLPYLKSRSIEEPDEPESKPEMTEILDQKNYLEEHNIHLKKNLESFKKKLEDLQMNYDELAEAKNEGDSDSVMYRAELEQLRAENRRLKAANEYVTGQKKLEETSSLDSFPSVSSPDLPTTNTASFSKLEHSLGVEKNLRQQAETALRSLERDVHEKQDTILGYKRQLDDLKAVNVEMFEKLHAANQALKTSSEQTQKIETDYRKLKDRLKQQNSELRVLRTEKQVADETARKLAQDLANKELTRSVLETDLKLEQSQRGSLETSLDEHKDHLAEMHQELAALRAMQESFTRLQNEYEEMRQIHDDQEETLAELGKHLSQEKLKNEEIKEWAMAFDPTSAAWQDDEKVTECKLCEKAFTNFRRKHHCRNCGGIFCNACSDNNVRLPSAPKPVRCCDTCHIRLLSRAQQALE